MSNQIVPSNGDSQSLAVKRQQLFSQHEENFRKTSVKNKKDLDLSLPTPTEIEECRLRTKEALQKIIDLKMMAKSTTGLITGKKDDLYVKYTPTNLRLTNQTDDNAPKQRIIKIVEAEQDPMLPPKFKNNQKTPALPDSALANTAVLKGSQLANQKKKPLTVEEQKAWYIPPAISNWKNPKGFTIAIDKRLAAFNSAAEGKDAGINDNFSKLASSLYQADQRAREEIKARNRLRIKQAEQKRLENEEKLRALAFKARESRQGNDRQNHTNEFNARQRELDRKQRLLKYEKQLKQNKLSNDQKVLQLVNESSSDDRLNSRIALGLSNANATTGKNNEEMTDNLLDARLFTNAQKFRPAGSEGQIYDTPLFNTHEAIQNIYTVSNSNTATTGAEEELNNLAKYNRFKVLGGGVDKDKVAERTGAVKFAKASSLGVDNDKESDDKDYSTGDKRYGLGDDERPAKKSRWDDDDDDDE